MTVLGLIPARGGSKGIPRKNIVPLAGKPLLAWTCEAARASASLTRVVLSTDDLEIAEVGRSWGVEVPFLRPPDLARDDTPSVDVALHALNWLNEHDSWQPELLVLLQPTSPLRQARHIDEAVVELQRLDADTVVSVVEVPHCFHPWSVMKQEGAWLEDFLPPLPGTDRFRRQNLPRLYARNGPAVLVTRVARLHERRSFYGERVAGYLMGKWASVDIDDRQDLELAELWLQRGPC